MRDKEHCNPLLFVSVYISVCEWVEWVRLLGCFCHPGLSFLELLAKTNLKTISPTPPFLKCGIRQNSHSECTVQMWPGLSVLEGLHLSVCSP